MSVKTTRDEDPPVYLEKQPGQRQAPPVNAQVCTLQSPHTPGRAHRQRHTQTHTHKPQYTQARTHKRTHKHTHTVSHTGVHPARILQTTPYFCQFGTRRCTPRQMTFAARLCMPVFHVNSVSLPSEEHASKLPSPKRNPADLNCSASVSFTPCAHVRAPRRSSPSGPNLQ
jgi:hypothetical protein